MVNVMVDAMVDVIDSHGEQGGGRHGHLADSAKFLKQNTKDIWWMPWWMSCGQHVQMADSA